MAKNNSSEDNKKFALQTLGMLNPILSKKQFQLVNLEVALKIGKLSKDQYIDSKKMINEEINNLQRRILREVLIVEN